MLFISSTSLKLAYLVERKAVSGPLLELPPLLHQMLLFSIKDVDIVCLVVQKNSFIIFNILSQQRVCPWHGIALQLVALASLENFLLPILSFLCSCHLSAAPYFYIPLTKYVREFWLTRTSSKLICWKVPSRTARLSDLSSLPSQWAVCAYASARWGRSWQFLSCNRAIWTYSFRHRTSILVI